jgi:2-methylisocitrate lyase-like PEP mutase family enzyme
MTHSSASAGARLRAARQAENPLQIVGAITAYTARMAEAVGFRAVYLSGGGSSAGKGADLYQYLDYHHYEAKLDELFGKSGVRGPP